MTTLAWFIIGVYFWAVMDPIGFGSWARKIHQAFCGNIKP